MNRTATWCSELARLLRSGLLVDHALPLAGAAAGGGWVRRSAAAAEACRAGRALADGLVEAGVEPTLSALVRAGEASGRLPDILIAWADRCAAMTTLRNDLIARLIYPLGVITFALVVQAIPATMATGGWWRLLVGPFSFWLLLACLASMGWWAWRQESGQRLALARGPLRWLLLPWWSADLLLVLSAADGAGMRIAQAGSLAASTNGNPLLSRRLVSALEPVAAGATTLAEGLRAAGFDAAVVALVTAGEVAGRRAESLQQAALVSAEQARQRAGWAVRVLVALVFTLAALITAWTVISMYAGILGGSLGH